MMLNVRLLYRLFRFKAGGYFAGLMVLVIAASFHASTANAQAVSNLFVYPFNLAVTKISLLPSTRWGLFRESDTITVSNTDNSTIRIVTLTGAVVYLGPPTTLQLTRGHYFVECNGDRTQFAVLPNDYAGASSLGSEPANWNDSDGAARMTSMGVNWVRANESIWADVETNRNTWNWSIMDQVVAANLGRKIIAQSGDFVPSWVGTNEIISLHTAFVQALATRYKGKLAAIEIWNEPYDDKFPNTTNVDSFVSFYLQLFSQAQQAIKAIDPTPQVIGPAWANAIQLESLAMATNPLATFDGWSWHDYTRGSSAPDVDYLSPVWIRSITKANLLWNFGRFANLSSLFVDELGLYGHSALGTDTGPNSNTVFSSSLDWHRGMCRAIKTAAMYSAAGVTCMIPHVFPLGESLTDANYELFGWDYGMRGPHPKTTAFLMTGYWLDGATLVDYRTPGTNVFLYAWQRTNNTSVVFAWAQEGQTVPLLSSALPATDIYGSSITANTLTETPVLFQSSSLTASSLLAQVMAILPPGLNLPPVFSPIASQSGQKGSPLQFTVSATDPNRYPLTYSASSLPLGASFNTATGVFSWTPAANQVGTYTVTFTSADQRATSAPISVTINVVGNLFDGLVDYWKFDEGAGTNTADSVGHANGALSQFTFIPPSGWVAGENGSALSLDGVGSSVMLPSGVLNFTNNFTVAASLYPRDAVGAGAFISLRYYYQSSGFGFYVDNNKLYLQGLTTAGWQSAQFGIGGIQNNTWYQVVIVYDKSNILAYLNGVYLGSAYWGGDMVMKTNTTSLIGNDGGDNYFNGIVDDVMLFNRTLGPNEIAMLPQGVFRSLTPTVTSLKLNGADAVISFTTVSSIVTNEHYEVDFRSDQKTGTWSILTNGIPGNGSTLSITDKGAALQGQRFYRVVGHF